MSTREPWETAPAGAAPDPTLPNPGALDLPPGVPDPAAIGQLANAFFRQLPGTSSPGPGAALPSAPIFSAQPIYQSVPGLPAVEPSLIPNQNPGLPPAPVPFTGAAQPAVPIFSLEPAAASVPPPQRASQTPESISLPYVPGQGAVPAPVSAYAPAAAAQAETAAAGVPASADPRANSFALDGFTAIVATLAGEAATERAPFAASPADAYYFLNRIEVAPKASPFDQAPDYARLPPQHRAETPAIPQSGARAFDPHLIRRDFPILHQHVNGRPLVWLDNAATTQKPQAVIDRLACYYERENSNVHRGAHALAARSTDAYESARQKVSRFINAPTSDSIVFVRGATEGINLIAKAWGGRNVAEGDEIVITHLEHHANIVPWQQLAAEKGARLRVAPVDDTGQIILDEYEKLLNPRTRIVSISQVSNALGTVTPLQEMIAMAHRHGAVAVADGAQSVSHMPIDVQALDADFFVFSGHKMFGPTGIGVVYGRPSILAHMPPWQGGGNMIADVTFEKTTFQGPPLRFEAGTGNIADAVGLGAAIDYLDTIGMSNIAAYEHELLAYATQGLLTVPGLHLIGTAREKAGVISFVLDECRTEDVGKALDQQGIAVRSGHHCAQPILRRFGLESTVRPSLALYNTPQDIDALVDALLRIQSGRGYRAG